MASWPFPWGQPFESPVLQNLEGREAKLLAQFLEKLRGWDRMLQKLIIEFDDQAKARRTCDRLRHAADRQGLVAFDVDLREIDDQIGGEKGVDRRHLVLDRLNLR